MIGNTLPPEDEAGLKLWQREIAKVLMELKAEVERLTRRLEALESRR